MPRPESERTLVLRGLDDLTANRAMTAALGSPFDVSGAAHVPNSALRDRSGRPWRSRIAAAGGDAAAAGGHCGFRRPSRGRARRRLLAPFGAAEMLEDAASAAIWAAVRDVQPFAAGGTLGAWPVWRIVCPPASGGALGERLARDTGRRRGLRLGRRPDLGGAAARAGCPGRAGARARRCRRRPRDAAARGRARCDAMSTCFIRSRAALPRLSERVRHSFDPKNILNRGRLIRGSAA